MAQLGEAGCSRILRYSEMLKHFFETKQGPLRFSLSSVSVLHRIKRKNASFVNSLHIGG